MASEDRQIMSEIYSIKGELLAERCECPECQPHLYLIPPSVPTGPVEANGYFHIPQRYHHLLLREDENPLEALRKRLDTAC